MKSFTVKVLLLIYRKLVKLNRVNEVSDFIKKGVLDVGKGTYGHGHLKIYEYKGSYSKISIGKYSSIAPNVTIITGGIHPIKTVSQFPFRAAFNMDGAYLDGNPYSKGDIVIGSDVWIGSSVTILSGVRIGDGVIIYNNSLVNRSIPPYSIVGGVPARILGKRFDDHIIEDLISIQWWNWDEKCLKEMVNELTSENVEEFVAKYKFGHNSA